MQKRIKKIERSDKPTKYIPQVKDFNFSIAYAYHELNYFNLVLATIFSAGLIHIYILIACHFWVDLEAKNHQGTAIAYLNHQIMEIELKRHKKAKVAHWKKISYITLEDNV